MSSVLIVDDEPDITELFESEFQEFGFSTFCAADIHAAKIILQSNTIDVVLSDVRMPGGNGMELLKWVRAHCPPSLIFLIMTGYSDVSLAEALSLGAHGLFAKPIDLEKVIGYTRACIELRQDTENENRRSTRKQVHFTGSITPAGESTPIAATLLDLSRGGFFVSCENEEIYPGMELDFCLKFYVTRRFEISGRAIIRWMKPLPANLAQSSTNSTRTFGAGAKFLYVDENSKEALLSILTILEIYPIGDIPRDHRG